MNRKILVIGFVAMVVAVMFGSLLPAGARLLPWYAPELTHVGVYALLTIVLALALHPARGAVTRAIAIAGGIGLAIELAQQFVPVRQFSVYDAMLNLVGAGAGGVLAGLTLRWWSARGARRRSDAARDRSAESGASALSAQMIRLAEDRLIPAWSLLHRRGLLSDAGARLASRVAAQTPALGNAVRADRDVLEAMAEAGIDCLVLKGTMLAHQVYDSPDQRARGDTDVLVAPDQRAAAETVLGQLGFARPWTVTAKTSDTQDQWVRNDPAGAVSIDLHWQLLNHPAFDDVLDFGALWQGRQSFAVDGFRAAGIGRAHALLHAVVHYFAHHGDEFRPRQWLLDMDLLWRDMQPDQRAETISLAKTSGVSGLFAEALARTRSEFETPIDDALIEALNAAGATQWRTGLLKTDGRPIRALLFKLRARRGWRARLLHLRALLFPSREYMVRKYPGAPGWVLPWLYLRRILGI